MSHPIFDAHCHIIDPRFALKAIDGLVPKSFNVLNYLNAVVPLGIIGGVVVSEPFQGFDQGYLLDALRRLGKGYIGVTQLPASVTDAELKTLGGFGVRGVRFDLVGGDAGQLEQAQDLAVRVFRQAGWHCELHINSRDLPDLESRLLQFPRLSIDHLGLSREGLPGILRLAQNGVRIKASGFGRTDFAIAPALRDIFSANPHALMFGTDLPSLHANRTFQASDVEIIRDTLSERGAQMALWDNAMSFYGL